MQKRSVLFHASRAAFAGVFLLGIAACGLTHEPAAPCGTTASTSGTAATITKAVTPGASAWRGTYEVNDVHVHVTNYVQEGITAHSLLDVMGNKVGRAVLFGIPLQQTWSYRVSGDYGPTYYLHTDAPLYYYSFTDAVTAAQYRALPKEMQERLDPMIIGFNPADMYAADHIKRVLTTFPGVFSGIGEFTIHKEFVSAKIAGEVPSLRDPALDRLLDFAAEVGLVALMHNDITIPFSKDRPIPAYLSQMMELLGRHPKTTLIWAHTGLGRVIQPVGDHLAIIESILADSKFSNVYFDISWDVVAKYVVSSPATITATARLINKFPDRFLFGSDEVAPTSQEKLLAVYRQYAPLFAQLDPVASEKVRKKNYERLFDEARRRVREWERTHAQ